MVYPTAKEPQGNRVTWSSISSSTAAPPPSSLLGCSLTTSGPTRSGKTAASGTSAAASTNRAVLCQHPGQPGLERGGRRVEREHDRDVLVVVHLVEHGEQDDGGRRSLFARAVGRLDGLGRVHGDLHPRFD